MRGYNEQKRTGHAWVCDGVRREVYDMEYYVEYINSVNEYTNYGETLIANPHVYASVSTGTKFHMNWGAGGKYNDWYISISSVTETDYSLDRMNIYVRKP